MTPHAKLYKDKTISTPILTNTPKTRIALFLVTVTLLIAYSVFNIEYNSQQHHQAGLGGVSSTNTPVQTGLSRAGNTKTTEATYKDSDVDYSKHPVDLAKVGAYVEVKGKKSQSSKNNGMDAEEIDRNLDSKVVGSISKGSQNKDEKKTPMQEKLDKEKEAEELLRAVVREKVKADVTKAYKEEAQNWQEKIKKARSNPAKDSSNEKEVVNTRTKLSDEKDKVEHAEKDHLKDHLKPTKIPTTRKPAPTKVMIGQEQGGDLRVLDRIDMSS